MATTAALAVMPFILFQGTDTAQAGEPPSVQLPQSVNAVLTKYCVDCHGPDKQKGKVRLDTLPSLRGDARADLLNTMQELVRFKEMPPEKKKQPTDAERKLLDDWIGGALQSSGPSKLDEKMRQPGYGNFVDHDQLFSGDYADLKGFTRDRRWLISEFIFNAKVNQLIDHPSVRTIDGKSRNVIGDNGVNLGTRFGGHNLRQSITNPFLLPTEIGVRYYDTTALTGGHLLTMISNARKIAAYMSSEQAMKAHYPVMYRIMKMEWAHREILSSREQFLNTYIENVAQDIYKERNEALLPEFVRIEVDEVPLALDSKGNPKAKEDVELLRGRFDLQDVQAIYRGIQSYKKEGVSYGEVVEECERDWFNFGIHEKRLIGRVSLMKILDTRWDLQEVYEDVEKQNMALPPYQPLSESEMQVINASIRKHREQDDRYSQIIEKCMTDWDAFFKAERVAAGQADEGQIADLVVELFAKIYERKPSGQETQENVALTKAYMQTLSNQEAIAKLIETLILSSEVVYRSEFGQGPADEHGRRMMSPRDASYALAYALTDSSPDEELVAAVKGDRLSTREDYRREVIRMLKRRDQYYVIDEEVQKAGFNASITSTPIRKLRFFREFFGYTKAMTLFKDNERFIAPYVGYDNVKGRLVDEADMLVDHILQKDQNVFEELLTTEDFYVFHSGNNEAMKASSARLRKIYDYFRVYDWENFTEEQLYEHWDFIDEMKIMGTVFSDFQTKRRRGWVRSFKTLMASYTFRFANGQTAAAPYDGIPLAYWNKGEAATRTGTRMRGEYVGRLFGIDYANWDYPTTQPAKVANRKGMLTHPAWLIAHSLNLETDPVRRGKWVREKLLAGTIPDVPITVDAVIPEDHHKTLRQRLEKTTGDDYCWKCHKKMDPLGLPFEMYDDFGRYRTDERLEHPDNLIKKAPRERGLDIDGRPVYKTLPVNPKGYLDSTGVSSLDGEVKDAIDLADRLAKSPRVRQSIIRHAFRYFMGRNEVLSDSQTLIAAEQAYLDSGGSFDGVIVSLLTSDSFIYRKTVTQP